MLCSLRKSFCSSTICSLRKPASRFSHTHTKSDVTTTILQRTNAAAAAATDSVATHNILIELKETQKILHEQNKLLSSIVLQGSFFLGTLLGSALAETYFLYQ